MYVVQCMFGCGTWLKCTNKPQLRWCGVHRCAEKAMEENRTPDTEWISLKNSFRSVDKD